MFYRPKDGHGLPHNPFNAIIVPRPIAWISTRSRSGAENLAPYSFFNGVAYEPPQIMFATTTGKSDRDVGKDTLSNIIDSEVFCVNIVESASAEKMNLTSGDYPKETDEFEHAEIRRGECETVECSMVTGAPANLECKLVKTVKLPGESNHVVFGEVTGVHLRDDCLVDGVFDVTKFQPLARLGYRDYSVVRDLFSLKRPGE